MRLVLQRVKEGGVIVDGGEARRIGPGLVALLGVAGGDDEAVCRQLAEKMAELRIFSDENGNQNLSLRDIGGDCLIVSNFTLYANCRKGRRPSFTDAAPPGQAEVLYREFVRIASGLVPGKTVTGEFGAYMEVEIRGDGPVTILLDSEALNNTPRRS